MSEAIVLGCSPKNNRVGSEAVLYVWENNETKSYVINRPHTFCTKRMTEDDAIARSLLLSRQFKDRKDVVIKRVQSGKNAHVLQIMGPRDISRLLPDYFLKKNHISDLLDWSFPVFSKVSIESNKILGNSKPAKLDELLQLPLLGIDLELDKNGTDKYIRINTAAIATKDGAGAMCIFDGNGCTQEQLISHVAEYIRRRDPAIICSHNIAFDLLKPKDFTGAFEIGVEGWLSCSPVIKGGVGTKTVRDEAGIVIERKGFPKVEVAGRQLFCSMSYARNNLWASNNRLETIADFLGINYKKSLDYDSLEKLVQAAEKGDKEACEKIKSYCADDVRVHFELAKRLLPVAVTEAQIFETDLISASFTSKSALARKLRDKRYFENLHTYRGDRNLELQEFDVYDEKLQLMGNKLHEETERGCFSEPMMVVFPTYLEQAFEKVLANEPSAAKLANAIRNSGSVIDRIIFHRDLEALCEEPFYDLKSYISSMDINSKGRFLGRYGGVDPNWLEKVISAKLLEFVNLLEHADVDIVNYTNRFLILRPRRNLESSKKILCDSSLVEFYGLTDNLISGAGGRVLTAVNGIALTSDYDIHGRKGLRTDFERKIYSCFAEFVTDKISKADLFVALREKFEDLAQGKVPKEELVYHLNADLEPWEYSWPAQSHERVKVLKDLGASKGEKVVFGYGDNGRCRVDEFLSEDCEIDLDQYYENFFGKKTEYGRSFSSGSISDLIYSICPARSRDEREELTGFLEGNRDLESWPVYQLELF